MSCGDHNGIGGNHEQHMWNCVEKKKNYKPSESTRSYQFWVYESSPLKSKKLQLHKGRHEERRSKSSCGSNKAQYSLWPWKIQYGTVCSQNEVWDTVDDGR